MSLQPNILLSKLSYALFSFLIGLCSYLSSGGVQRTMDSACRARAMPPCAEARRLAPSPLVTPSPLPAAPAPCRRAPRRAALALALALILAPTLNPKPYP